jgi:hypothetical protein
MWRADLGNPINLNSTFTEIAMEWIEAAVSLDLSDAGR